MIFGHFNQTDIDKISELLEKHQIPFTVFLDENHRLPGNRVRRDGSFYQLEISDEVITKITPELYRPLEKYNIYIDPALDQSHHFEELTEEVISPIDSLHSSQSKPPSLFMKLMQIILLLLTLGAILWQTAKNL